MSYIDWFNSNFNTKELNSGLRFVSKYAEFIICNIFNQLEIFNELNKKQTIKDIVEEKKIVNNYSVNTLEFLCQWLVGANLLGMDCIDNKTYYYAKKKIPLIDMQQINNFPIAKYMKSTTELLDISFPKSKEVFHNITDNDKLYDSNIVSLWQNYFSQPGMKVPAEIVAKYICDNINNFKTPIRIMEVGAGSASGTIAIYNMLKKHNLLDKVEAFYVTDITAEFVEGSKNIIKNLYEDTSKFKFYEFDLNKSDKALNYIPESVDIILGLNCYHYVKDWESQVNSIKSILRNNGLLINAGYFRKDLLHPFHIELIGSLFNEYCDTIKIPKLRPSFGIMPANNFAKVLENNNYNKVELYPRLSVSKDIDLDFYCGCVIGKK